MRIALDLTPNLDASYRPHWAKRADFWELYSRRSCSSSYQVARAPLDSLDTKQPTSLRSSDTLLSRFSMRLNLSVVFGVFIIEEPLLDEDRVEGRGSSL